MASAFPLSIHTIDPASPFAENAFAQETICELALQIQETEFRFFNSLWRDVPLLIPG
jgi:hypothetical protein